MMSDQEQAKPSAAGSSDSTGESPENFDLARLRLPQNFGDTIGVKKRLVTMPVRKPHRQEFVRVHPDTDNRLETALLTFKGEPDGTYLVAPELWEQLSDEITPTLLLLATTPQAASFLWPLRLPRSDGRQDHWSQSALEAAQLAQDRWIRIVANMSQGSYDVWEATSPLTDPQWPDVTFQDVIKLAFGGRYIDAANHPILKRLRGEL
jgi:hypothetical protein